MFKILDPCRKKTWADMPGDELSRFCDFCGHQVHAIERYPQAEQRALLASSQKLCAMLKPEPMASQSRRALFVLSLLGTLRPLWAEAATIRLRVLKEGTSEPLPGATAVVTDATGKTLATAWSDSNGDARLIGLPTDRALSVLISRAGYYPWRKVLNMGEDLLITAAMEEGFIMGTIAVTRTRKPWWRRLF